ncbi:MAG: hypothetical protein ACR2H2_01185 [Solirubrobacteraceae bacterium]
MDFADRSIGLGVELAPALASGRLSLARLRRASVAEVLGRRHEALRQRRLA